VERVRRRSLLAAAGGAAAAAAVAVLARDEESPERRTRASRGVTARTTDRFGLGDVGIANFLLTLERVELDVYRQAARHGEPFRAFAEHERLHVERLERAVRDLGGRVVRRPRTRIDAGGRAALLRYALAVEDLAVGACLGQLAVIATPELLRLVLALHSVDARHAAVLAQLSGLDPVSDGPLANPLDAGTVLARLRPLARV
jgi:hypothetical protein